MSYNKKMNRNIKQVNDYRYRPSVVGKVALSIAAPAAILGFLAIIVAFFWRSQSANCFLVCVLAEVVAVLAGVVLIVDMVLFNRRAKKESQGKGKPEKKEKNIGELIHFVVGFVLGLVLGLLIRHF